jgi:PAS domain-containing protein
MIVFMDRETKEIIHQSRSEIPNLNSKYELLLNSIFQGVYGLDLEKKAIFWNKAAEEITGYKAQEILDKPVHPIIHHSHTDGSSYKDEDCPICVQL